jgi:hypothetical protein
MSSDPGKCMRGVGVCFLWTIFLIIGLVCLSGYAIARSGPEDQSPTGSLIAGIVFLVIWFLLGLVLCIPLCREIQNYRK